MVVGNQFTVKPQRPRTCNLLSTIESPFWAHRPKVKRPSIFTDQIARNHEIGLSTLHTRRQVPKTVAIQNAYVAILFDQGDGLSKEVRVGWEWKPNYG